MSSTRTLAASLAIAAAGIAWMRRRKYRTAVREMQFDQEFHKEALQIFENEGGLILT